MSAFLPIKDSRRKGTSTMFLSADQVQGNVQGMDAYSYVNGNPETAIDPTGQRECILDDGQQICPPASTVGGSNGSTGGTNGCQGGGSHGMSAMNCGVTNIPANNCSPKFSGPNCLGNPGTDCANLSLPACNHAKQAYRDAKDARDAFQHFSDIFNSGVFLAATFFANLLNFILGPIWAGIITGLLQGLALLGRIAGDIASGFKQETNQEDLRTGQGLAYFLSDNLEIQDQNILATAKTEGMVAFFAGWAEIFTAILAGNGIASWGLKLLSKAENLAAGGVTTGIVTAIVAGVGSIIMYNVVSSDVAKEESDASV